MKPCTKFVIALWVFFLLSLMVHAQRGISNKSNPVVYGGNTYTTINNTIYEGGASTFIVVQDNHFTLPTYGFIPVYNDNGIYKQANLDHIDSTAVAFVVGKSGDTLTIQQNGRLIVGSHGLNNGAYYMDFWVGISQTKDDYIVQKLCEVVNDSLIILEPEQVFQIKTIDREPLQSEYYNVLAYAVTQSYTLPDYNVRVLQNNLVKALKDSSIFQVMDYLHVMITGDTLSQFAKINWKNPGQFTLIPTGTIYSGNYGFTSTTNNSGNITFNYLTPANVANFLQNTNSMNYYVTISNGQNMVMNTNGGSGMHYVYLRNISINNYSGGTYNTSSPGFTCSTCSYGNHVYSIERTVNTSVTLYANGSSVATLNSTSNTGSNRVHQYLANFSTAGAYIGIGMSGSNITGKQSYLNNLLKQYVYDIQAR